MKFDIEEQVHNVKTSSKDCGQWGFPTLIFYTLEWGEYKLISSHYHGALEMPCINIYKGERLVGGLSDLSENPYINGVRINHDDLKWQMLEFFDQWLLNGAIEQGLAVSNQCQLRSILSDNPKE